MSEGALFRNPAKFQLYKAKLRDGIAHVDAAYGGDDYTAFGCANKIGDTIYAYGRIWRKHVDLCIDEIKWECEQLMCAPIYCESNSDKGYLAKELRAKGLSVISYHERLNKYQKISSYLRKWWSKIIWLDGTDPEYISQIMDYTEDAEHDDAPDNAACLCRLLDREKYKSLT
jgi:hypothetical protein